MKIQIPNQQKKGVYLWAAGFILLLLISAFLHVFAASDGFPVRINEILAGNTNYPNEEGRCCDYIELYNAADHPVDLTGYQLGDIAGSSRYRIPNGTMIEANNYLVIYCDKTVKDDQYANFAISRSGGESFYLIASNGAIVDSVVTVAMDQNEPMVRLDAENWGTGKAATPGHSNEEATHNGRDIYNVAVSSVRISEFSSAGSGYSEAAGVLCDWVELHNTGAEPTDISGFSLSDNVGNDKYIFPDGTVLQPDEYCVVYCSDSVTHKELAPFGLSQLGGESIVLKNSGHMIVEIVDTPAMNGADAMALLESAQWEIVQTPSPGFENTKQGHDLFLDQIGAAPGTIVISEVMAGEQGCMPDSFGAFPDWVELHNTGSEAVHLAGWFLSDDASQSKKWEIPTLNLEPDAYAIIFCSGRNSVKDGQLHAGFSLSSGGEEVVLTSYLGTQVDKVTFGESDGNCSYVFDEEPVLTQYPTPGFANDEAGYDKFCESWVAKDALAIWEVMSSNDWYLPQALGVCYDWVELKNTSDQPILLSDYSLSDDPDVPALYTLPAKTLEPGGLFVVILSGDVDLTGTYDHAGFALDGKEDLLLLYKQNELVDHVYLKNIPVGGSYGRSSQTGGFSYMQPTPKDENESGDRMISSMPVSQIESGVYNMD